MGDFSERFLCRCATPHKQETHALLLEKSFRLLPPKEMRCTNIKLFPPDCHSCSCANLTFFLVHTPISSRRPYVRKSDAIRFCHAPSLAPPSRTAKRTTPHLSPLGNQRKKKAISPYLKRGRSNYLNRNTERGNAHAFLYPASSVKEVYYVSLDDHFAAFHCARS